MGCVRLAPNHTNLCNEWTISAATTSILYFKGENQACQTGGREYINEFVTRFSCKQIRAKEARSLIRIPLSPPTIFGMDFVPLVKGLAVSVSGPTKPGHTHEPESNPATPTPTLRHAVSIAEVDSVDDPLLRPSTPPPGNKSTSSPSAYGFLLMLFVLGSWLVGIGIFGFAFLLANELNDLYVHGDCAHSGILRLPLRVPRRGGAWNARVLCSRLEDQSVLSHAAHSRREGAINDSKTLIAAHPHSILCCGMITTLVCAPKLAKSKVGFLVSDMLFKLPSVADLLGWAHCSPADEQTMLAAMKARENLSILPGGFQEATLYRRNEHRVFIRQRTGFIKYALMYGYKVHPSYIFGEEKTYLAVSWLQEKLMFFNKWKLLAAVFMGKWLGSMPENQLDMVTVVEKPLVLLLRRHRRT
jgi:hypothetical protein